MLTKIQKNGKHKYVYICDFCGKTFKKEMYQKIYTLKIDKKKPNHFCSYTCRSNFLKENK